MLSTFLDRHETLSEKYQTDAASDSCIVMPTALIKSVVNPMTYYFHHSNNSDDNSYIHS